MGLGTQLRRVWSRRVAAAAVAVGVIGVGGMGDVLILILLKNIQKRTFPTWDGSKNPGPVFLKKKTSKTGLRPKEQSLEKSRT